MTLTPPFPYFGSKRRAAQAVWQALGDPALYIEPFAGSLAVLLARPTVPRAEIAVDTDALVINWFRAVQRKPARVLALADECIVAEDDIEARHRWIVENRDRLTRSIRSDPDYYDVTTAAWWWQGVSSWLGSGYATATDPDNVPRQRPHVDRTLKGLYARGLTDERMAAVAGRLANVILLSGDWTDAWKRACTDSILRRFRHDVGVFLDPPYTRATGRAAGLYSSDDPLSTSVGDWCLDHGNEVRIVLAGYLSEYPLLPEKGWRVVPWGTHNGYAQGDNDRRDEDVLFLSPTCDTIRVDNPTPVG